MGNEKESPVEANNDGDLLLALVETLVPAKEGVVTMPAASELSTFRNMSPEEVQGIYGALLELLGAENLPDGGFVALGLPERETVLRSIERERPEIVRGVVLQTLIRYYAADDSARALGFPARPPHPGGYILGETNWSLLDPVRSMDPIYRVAPEQGEES